MSGPEYNSPKPGMPLWLLVVTLLGGAFLVQRVKQPEVDATPKPAESQAGNSTGSSASRDRMLAPLREFLGLTSVESADQGQAALKERIQNHVGLLESLVVMVADPIETGTNLRFDLQLDTLHKALGADGYVPDEFYLPWGPHEKDNAHQTTPGVLLYRRNGPSVSSCANQLERYDLLLVFLVGETPTSGIHKDAFLAAVRQIRSLGEMAPCPEPSSRSTIRVAGPLFTGAADSLALAIRQSSDEMKMEEKGSEKHVEFQVITGTAVSVDKRRFQTLAGKENVDFHSTVLSGTVLKEALINHVLHRTSAKKVRIAWLTETGTGYGASNSADSQESPAPTAAPLPAPAPATKAIAEIIEFRFPVNISKVRSSYAESRRRARSGQASLGPESSRLPIPFEDTGTARDVPPMLTPKVTAPTVELILSQILTTIRNEGIKYVGISSSDPRDPIFLAELVKEQCPDVQIMLVTSDLLHLHSEYRAIMHGTLVSSTHPLHPEAQDWCFPFGDTRGGTTRSIVMPNQYNYGLYNAVLLLRGLEREQYHHDHGDGSDESLLKLSYTKQAGWPGGLPLGYSLPFEKNIVGIGGRLRPPVWISRISPTGICPITVHATDDPYTLTLQIDEPPDSKRLPELHIRSRIPVSLSIAGLAWLVVASIYGAALLFPKPVGNWAKALGTVAEHPPEYQSLLYVFRGYITGSFVYVLIMFANLLYAFDRWTVSAEGDRNYGTVVQYVLGYVVATILALLLLADWGRAFRGLAEDLRSARKRLLGTSASSAEPDLSWHLIAARGVGLTMILVLVVIHVWATIWQRVEWDNHPDSFLWFKVTSDMWNGLSPAMTAQLLAMGLIVLAYGMLLQLHLLSPEFTITRPDPSTSASPSDAQRKQRLEEVQNALLFPLLCRWRRNRPVVLDILCVGAALLWLGFLGWHLQSPDYCAFPVSFPSTLLLFAGGFWCVRLFKLIQILKCLARHLEDITKALRKRWPDSWQKIFEKLPEKRVGLQELFWTSRPTASELEEARRDLQETQSMDADRTKAKQKLCAIEIDLYVRQFFHHIVRLGFGLALSACLLFLSAQAFPFSQEPLLRLSASIMLASIGCVMAWAYLKFDRNELLSYLVGTDPKRVSINWSLIQMVAPAVLFTAVALLSQTFPEIWQWMRSVLEPLARSSI